MVPTPISLNPIKHAMRRSACLAVLLACTLSAGPADGQTPAADPGTITLRLVPDPVNGRDLLLTVEAFEVDDLYGLSFELEFPKKRLRWKRNSRKAGPLLSDDGNLETLVLDRQRPRGLLYVGAARLGTVDGASGSGVLVEIGFVNRNKRGPRELVLVNPMAFSSSATQISDIEWNVIPFESQPPGT
jgi:hypothetical protein